MATSDIKKGPLYVDSTNNRVGIGTTGPQAPLDITGSPAGEHGAFIYNSNASGYSAVRLGNSDRGSNGDHLIYGSSAMGIRSKTGANITFEPAGTVRMTIDTSGRVTLSNQPYFLAKPNANYNPSQGSGHLLSATNVITNRGSVYNSTNSRFTAPVTGIYSITYGLTWYPANNGSYNGSYFTVSSGGTYYFFAPSGSDVNNLITADLELSANDYVTFYTYSGNASNGVQANSYISAYLLG